MVQLQLVAPIQFTLHEAQTRATEHYGQLHRAWGPLKFKGSHCPQKEENTFLFDQIIKMAMILLLKINENIFTNWI